MSKQPFAKIVQEDIRLNILRLLAGDADYSHNECIIKSALAHVGHSVSSDRVRSELSWLEEQGLVQVEDTCDVVVARLTARGLDVANGVACVPGVCRPLPGM